MIILIFFSGLFLNLKLLMIAMIFWRFCTVQELKTISQRIVVAKMLSEKCVYTDIVNATGASTATISRVNRSLQYGCDGYDKIFEKIKLEDENKNEENEEL